MDAKEMRLGFGPAFGKLVKRRRLALGLTQDELAKRASLSSGKVLISNLENGKVDAPHQATVDAIASVLEISQEELHSSFADLQTDMLHELLDELLARTEKSGDADRMRDEGITEKAIIRLAQRIAGETDDLGRAWLELQNAMDIAVRVQQEGRVPSNHGDFVDEVLKRVTALSADGEYTQAGDEIAEALAKVEAEKARLLRTGIEMAMLAGDSARTAALLVQLAEAKGQAGFEELRALWQSYYERGRDKGAALDLRIAIDLARVVQCRASTGQERGTALNDLGLALWVLGERDISPARLEQAIEAYRAALQEWTQDKVPLDWAMTQNNLGNALQALGARESDPARLEQAIEAYRAALQERTQDKVPLDWAVTQNNLGTALRALGERDSSLARLEQAIAAYWAALEERTQDQVPLDWAMTQNNLGNALRVLGESERSPVRLQQAVAALQAALQEWTRDKVPLNWAMTQGNLGVVYRVFHDVTRDPTYLEQALTHARAAREVFAESGANQYLAITDANIAEIEARRAG